MKLPVEVGAEFGVGERRFRVRRHVSGRNDAASIEVVELDSQDVFFVWNGPSAWARDVEDVMERLPDTIATPRIVEKIDDGSDAVLVLEGAPQTASPFDNEVWKAAPHRQAVKALQDFTQTLAALHRQGAWLQGMKREELYIDLVTQRIHLVAMVRLYVTHKPAVEAAWRDMRIVGELAYENFVDEEYPGGHEMAAVLQDRTAMEGTDIIFPGLPQVLAGCVSPYGDLAYQGAEDLWKGLEQLHIELARPFGFRVGAASTVGNYLFRKNNQDSCGHIAFQAICGSRKVSLGFFCVADGIGGIQDGEHASRLAVETACEAFARGWAHYGATPLVEAPVEFAQSIAKVVGQRLALEGEFEIQNNRGGTTFSGMVVAGNRLGVGHVGDSRIVLIRRGVLVPLTHDHTLANILIKLGELDPDDAEANDLSQRTISRFLSTATEVELERIDTFAPDVATTLNASQIDRAGILVRRGDLYVLTSDGAHGEVSDDEIVELSRTHEDPQSLCDAIVGLALERMGRDNSTTLAVLVE